MINKEYTQKSFVMVKPDGVQRGLIGQIIKTFENKGYKLAGLKFQLPQKDIIEKQYAHLQDKPYYQAYIKYMSSGPVCAMIWEGKDIIKQGRIIIGNTNPLEADIQSIRGKYGIDIGKTIIHGSDSEENAKFEINLWFKQCEIQQYQQQKQQLIYE